MRVQEWDQNDMETGVRTRSEDEHIHIVWYFHSVNHFNVPTVLFGDPHISKNRSETHVSIERYVPVIWTSNDSIFAYYFSNTMVDWYDILFFPT